MSSKTIVFRASLSSFIEARIKRQAADLDKLLQKSSRQFVREKVAAVANATEKARREGEAQALKNIETSLAGDLS